MTSTDGCSVRATEQACPIKRSAAPDMITTVDCRQLAQQVPDGVGLARARRAVQQQAALEVLAAGHAAGRRAGRCRARAARCRPARRAAGSRRPGPAAAGPGTAAARRRPRSNTSPPNDDHVPAEHVVPTARSAHLVQRPLRRRLVRGAGLQGDVLDAGPVVRPAQQQRDRAARVLDEVDGRTGRRPGSARPGPDGRASSATLPTPTPSGVGAGLQQVAEPEHLMPEPGQPGQLVRGGRSRPATRPGRPARSRGHSRARSR